MENEEEKGYLPVDPDIDLDVKSEKMSNDERLSDMEESSRAEEVSQLEEPSEAIAPEESSVEESKDLAPSTKENIHLPSFVPEEDIIMGNDYSAMKANSTESVKTGGKKKILVVVILIMLVVVATAAYIYYLKPEAQLAVNPDQGAIIKSSVEAMKGINKYNYDGKVSFNLDAKETDGQGGEQAQKADLNLVHKGVMDGSNQDSPNFYSSLVFDGNAEVNAKKGSGKLNTEFVLLDKIFYVKLNDVNFDNGTVYPADTVKQMEGFWEVIKGNWYFIPEEGLKDLTGTTATSEEASADSKAVAENLSRINEIISGHNLLKFDKDLGIEKVGETDTYHYQVKLDGREGFDLAVELIKESYKMQGDEDEAKSFEEEIQQKADEINQAKEMVDFVLNKINAEIWIGKSDNLIYRVKIDGNLDKDFIEAYKEKYKAIYGEKENGGINTDNETVEGNLNFSIDYTLSNFNTAAVRKPENAKDLKKIIEAFQSQVMSSVSSGSSVDTDGDGLFDGQEAFYGSDPKKPDTDGDGYKDGDEVKNGYDPTIAGSAKLDYAKLYKL